MPITMILTTGTDGLIDIELKVKNTVRDHRLRLRLASGIPTAKNLASVPFGFITRQNKPLPVDWEKKYAEKPVNIWPLDNNVTLMDKDQRLTVYTRDIKEYAQDGDAILLTLFATTDQLGKPNLLYRPGRASGDTTNEGHIMIDTPKAELLNQTMRYHLQVVLSRSLKEEDIPREQEQFSFRPVGYQRQQLNLFFHRLDNKLQDSLVERADLPTELSVYTAPSVGTVSACYPGYFKTAGTVVRLQNATRQTAVYELKQNQEVVNALEQAVNYDGRIQPYDAITILNRD
jgi:alpha-mannosidase